jgi:murein DD-endopeptidase MepM/ murein hydrolase activator NlpD
LKSSHYGKKSSSKIIIFIPIFILLSIFFLFFATDNIDKENPSISLKYNEIYVSKNKNIEIKLKDNINIKNYKVTLTDGNENIILDSKNDVLQKEIILDIKFPKTDLFFKKNNAILIIEAKDTSLWNFFIGNTATREVPLIFDDVSPEIKIISKSKSIRKGGSGVVVFSVIEENLQDLYISLGEYLKFKPTKFYKDGNYVSLMVWDVKLNNINANIIAIDKAGNKSITPIRIKKNFSYYKKSKIKLNNKFLNNKISNLYKSMDIKPEETDKLEKFININEKQRKLNSKLVLANAKNVIEKSINTLSINSFRPLRRYATVGSFGVFREFFYGGLKVSESYHLGIDIASIKNDSITTNNDAKVVFTDEVGIYGNSIILYHQLGIYSLYSHCSELFSYEGSKVKKGDIIAKTGQTGLAMGDHLHFSIIIQGVFARPNEWLSQNWINNNIISVLGNAKYIINQH